MAGKVVILRPGRFKEKCNQESAGSWLKMASRYADVELVEYSVSPASEEKEIQKALKGLKRSPVMFAADSRGELLSSEDFAAALKNVLESSRDLMIVIGGASGLPPAIVNAAARVIAWGRMTMNHDLAVVVTAEQIWRALCIINNHPYHRGH